MARITVIMPAYNAEKHIREACESILEQTYADFELLVIDDGSTDQTAEIIRSLNDSRIRLEQNGENRGLIWTLNRGLELSETELIARMDADDIALPFRFQMQVDFLDAHQDIAVVGSWVQEIPGGRTYQFHTDPDVIQADLLFFDPISHPVIMMRSRVIKDANLQYGEEWLVAEDYDLWARVAQFARIANIPEILLYYRIHPNQAGSSRRATQIKSSMNISLWQLANVLGQPTSEDEVAARKVVAAIFGRPIQFDEKEKIEALFQKIERANKAKRIYTEKGLQKSLSDLRKIIRL